MLTQRLRRLRARNDAGVSLIEMVVGMTLMTIIAAATTVFFVNFQNASDRTSDLNVGSAGARNALEQWVRLLNLADSPSTAGSGAGRFQQITPTSVIFYANSNRNRATTSAIRTAPTKIMLSLENGQLVQREYAPVSPTAPSTYPSSPTTTTYLVSKVTTAGWLFSPYVLATPPQLSEPNDCTNGAPGLCAGIPEADAILPTVIRVDVAFTVSPTSGGSESYSGSAIVTGGTT